MSIIACTVISDRDHPNADRLRCYVVSAPGVDPTPIVANKDNIYATGDIVMACLEGTILSDGTEIKRGKIRGEVSLGMLIGKTDAAPGTDLTVAQGATHKVKVVDESNGVVEETAWPRYTSIQGHLRLRDEIMACDEVVVTEKLHGSNVRFGYTSKYGFVVGTHTSRVLPTHMSSAAWPEGHLLRKTFDWIERENIKERVETWMKAHPSIYSLAIYGEVCGFKCSDLHYGRAPTDAEPTTVRLFGEVSIDNQPLDYPDALAMLTEMFPDLKDRLVPVLYVGKPDADILRKLRDQPSAYAAERGVVQISEGVVIRPTREKLSPISLGRLISKYKSPLYEERKSLRSADPDKLPVYVSAYDLLQDFVTDERILHVIQRAEASGIPIVEKSMNQLGSMLYQDIRKESVGEWPAGSESMDEGVLTRWVKDMACDSIARIIQDRAKGAY